MNTSLHSVPFSRYGSYFCFSYPRDLSPQEQGLYLRTVHGNAWKKEMFRLEVIHDGKPIPFEEKISPELLTLETSYGKVEICIHTPKAIRIHGSGVGLRLSADHTGMFDYTWPEAAKRWQVNCMSHQVQLMVSALQGEIEVDAPWHEIKCERIVITFLPDTRNQTFDVCLEEFKSSYRQKSQYPSFAQCVTEVRQDFAGWMSAAPTMPDKYAEARELAAYINWSCVVEAEGLLKRPSMFMSKNWMTNVWSWDHCFNAMALFTDVPMAWNQLVTLFDHQDPFGAIPDSINDGNPIFNFCKPPIHGWALAWLMNHASISSAMLDEIYPQLCRWTNWWLTYRDPDKDGLPQYNHGNDSGWDNSTVFGEGIPIESPDLCAFLIVQMEVLADVASRLGKADEGQCWAQRAEEMFTLLMAELWNGEQFIARHAYTHQPIVCDSLLTYMPVLLGNRLPKEVLTVLVDKIKAPGKFLTQYGLATEMVSSPHYLPDGYWRGPIWAPSTMLIVDGLRTAGEHELAADIAQRFCDMAGHSGMAENYDALTGEGLRDKAYTWTSSVFLVLGNQYLAQQDDNSSCCNAGHACR